MQQEVQTTLHQLRGNQGVQRGLEHPVQSCQNLVRIVLLAGRMYSGKILSGIFKITLLMLVQYSCQFFSALWVISLLFDIFNITIFAKFHFLSRSPPYI